MSQASQLVKQWIRPEIQAISAYPVADATGMVKLDAMENPYGWPETVKNTWLQVLAEAKLNRYPDPQAQDLKQQLRESLSLPSEMSLILGNGSDEIIQMIVMAMAGSDSKLLSVEPGFVMYRMIATFCGIDYVGVPLKTDDFSLDMPRLLEAIETEQPAVIFLAYPNNPTANLFAEQDLLQVLDKAPGLVVIDEAYAPFTDASFISRLAEFDNLVVMRTLSKMGLAGLRLGYLVGSQVWLEQFEKVRMPYNINVLTQLSTAFCLQHKIMLDEQTQAIRSSRSELMQALQKLEGISVYPSEANFILIRTATGKAAGIFASMKQSGVLIKKLHGSHPLLEDCLRLTVGTAEENQACLKALSKAL